MVRGSFCKSSRERMSSGDDPGRVQVGPVKAGALIGVAHRPLEPRQLVGPEFVFGLEGWHKGLLAQIRLLQSDIGQSRRAQPRRGRVVVGTRPQEGPAQFRVHQEFVAPALAHDPAVGQKIGRPGGGEGPGGVLLHQEDGHPAPGQLLDDVEDLVGDQRRQPQGRLIQEQQPGLGHQGPAHGHHLLLARRRGCWSAGRPVP